MTFPKAAAHLNDAEVEEADGYRAPEETINRVTFSELKIMAKEARVKNFHVLSGVGEETESFSEEADKTIGSFLCEGPSGQNNKRKREPVMEAFDRLLFVNNKELENDPFDSDVEDQHVAANKKKGNKVSMVYDPLSNERVLKLVGTTFDVICADAMCNIRRVFYSDIPYDREEETNNDHVYESVASSFIRTYFPYLTNEDSPDEIHPCIVVICADIKAENELRSFETNRRDEKSSQEREEKKAKNTDALTSLPLEIAISEGEDLEEYDDKQGHKMSRTPNTDKGIFTFSAACSNRSLRYSKILPGILRAFSSLKNLPKGMLLLTRGFMDKEALKATDDKNMSHDTLWCHNPATESRAVHELDGVAYGIGSQEGEIACVAAAYALAVPNMARKIYLEYYDSADLYAFPGNPIVGAESVDGDIGATGVMAQNIFPETKNVYVIHAGQGAKVKSLYNLHSFSKNIIKKYGTVVNYIAILSTSGNDYCDKLNRTSPTAISKIYLQARNGAGGASKPKKQQQKGYKTVSGVANLVHDMRLATGSVPGGDMERGIKWWEDYDLVSYNKDETPDGFPYFVNPFMMCGLLLQNKLKTKAKAAKVLTGCRCEDDYCGPCKDGKDGATVHKMMTVSTSVQTYLNYLVQQLSPSYKIQYSVTDNPSNVTAFYKDSRGKVRMGLRKPSKVNEHEYKSLFGESADDDDDS